MLTEKNSMGFWHWDRMPASVPATGESKKNKKVSMALGSHEAGKGDKSVYSKFQDNGLSFIRDLNSVVGINRK